MREFSRPDHLFRECEIFKDSDPKQICDPYQNVSRTSAELNFAAITSEPFLIVRKFELESRYIICGPIFGLIRLWACQQGHRLSFKSQYQDEQEMGLALVMGEVFGLVAPIPALKPEEMRQLARTVCFAYIDMWRIKAPPVAKSWIKVGL